MPELNPVCHTVDHRPGWGPRETKGIHSPKTQERRHENNLNVHPTEIANTDSSQNTGIQYSTENGRGLLYSCAGRSRKHSGAKEASCSSQTWLVFTQFQSNKTYITVTGLELGVTSTQAVILDSFLVFWRKGQQNRNSRNTLACRQSAGKDAPQGHENCPYWTDIFFFETVSTQLWELSHDHDSVLTGKLFERIRFWERICFFLLLLPICFKAE